MNYINPIEILELQAVETSSIDSSVIKKAKKKLFADIELSDDGHFDYWGYQLTKSDCERAIDELEEKDNVEFYSHLASNRQLNEFLANGTYELLDSFKQESIYKLPEFVDFVSPYFSEKLDRALLKLFQDNNLELLAAALRTEFLLNQSGLNNAYRSLSGEIQRRIAEIDEITESIKEEDSDYTEDSIKKVIKIVKKVTPIDLLHVLPNYFQSQINKIASSINSLLIAILLELNITLVPLRLSEHLLKLNIDSVGKATFEENYVQIKEKHQDRLEQKKHAPVLEEWAGILLTIQSKVNEVEEERLKSKSAYQFVNDSLRIEELNGLPTFANEIRAQIAYSIRSIAIACWNNQSDMKSALLLIRLALEIKIPKEAELRLKEDKAELEKILRKSKGVFICYFCGTNPTEEGCSISKTVYKVPYRRHTYDSYTYSYKKIEIPRCGSCKKAHSWSLFKSKRKLAEAGIKDASVATLEKHPLIIELFTYKGNRLIPAPGLFNADFEYWTFTKPC